MSIQLNKTEEAFLCNILKATNNSYQMDGITPNTLVNEKNEKVLSDEQTTNFDTYINSLYNKGYITKLQDARALEDVTGCYYFEFVPDATTYFEDKKSKQKTEKRLSRKEWLIAIIGSVVGAIVTEIIRYLPSIIKWIGELFNAY